MFSTSGPISPRVRSGDATVASPHPPGYYFYGAGGSVAYLQMLPFFQTRLAPDDLAAVFRLRYAILAAAAMVGALMAPVVLRAEPPAWVIVACGVVLALTGVVAGARPPGPSPLQRSPS